MKLGELRRLRKRVKSLVNEVKARNPNASSSEIWDVVVEILEEIFKDNPLILAIAKIILDLLV